MEYTLNVRDKQNNTLLEIKLEVTIGHRADKFNKW